MFRLLLFFIICITPLHAEFRAAAVTVDITPETPQMLRGYSSECG